MEACGGCGLEINGGEAACQQLFDAFRAREATDLAPSYAATRLTVDIYCLQHPDRYCVSAKSLAAHLTGLAWALERGGSDAGLRALQRWLNGRVDITKPPVPDFRGAVTIGDVHQVHDREAYLVAVDRWAQATWAAYESLHAIARQWIDLAVGQA
jgi:Family of unknown function (DUF5946)